MAAFHLGMTTIPHEIIRASAGTGKTFALSDRIVRLLALGVAPETLIALTFTRKAAAEFAAAVFRKLAEAALDDGAAHALAARLKLEPRTSVDFAATLASTVAAMNRLQFGTLDAFFQRIVGTIPFELGLSGPIQILDPKAAAESRALALRRLLHPGADEDTRRSLLDAFRAATWGADEKQLFPRLLGFIDAGHDLFLEAPDAATWGQEESIWPEGCAWLPAPKNVAADAAHLLDFAETLEGRFADAVRKFATHAAQWQPGMDLPNDAVAGQLFARLAGGDTADALELTYYKKLCVIPGKWTPVFQRIVRHYLGASLAQALRAAQGTRRLIADYDRLYGDEIRRTGRLAFADVLELLRRIESTAWQPRLDSRFSHWLFDEFQDTSVRQWSVLADIIDEVLQDPSGERSVFFVGDPKQAIYRWRGGEHRLLARFSKRYGEAIQVRPLDRSYRSAPAVIEFVNRFGDFARWVGDRLPAAAVDEWRAGWSPHVSAVAASEGHVRVHTITEKDELYDALLNSLREVDPIGRGLTCAILTRGNDEAAEIALGLRERGFLEIAAETDVSIATDQPMTQALLAVISAAAHPDDMASRRVVEMSPLAHWLDTSGGWAVARGLVLDALTIRGYEATLREILSLAPGAIPLGRFGARRIGQLFEIARNYDSGTVQRPDDFVRYAREATHRETASAGRVQVMTIHKAKGLGFDFVMLPMRTNRRLDAVESDPLLVSRDESQSPEWILGRPSALVIEADATLRRAQAKQRIDAAYESLCVLYVALTRARFGLHVFIGPPSAEASALSAADLIRGAISQDEAGEGLPWEHGNASWFEQLPREVPDVPSAPVRVDWAPLLPARRLPATLPSRSGTRGIRGSSPESAAFGAAVHEAFAAIEWEGPAGGIWPARIDPVAAREVEACLDVPAIAALFERPGPDAMVWRERAFDLVLDKRWVSGVFDRVVLASGELVLVEFKTGRGSATEAVTLHAPQIKLYRAALARLTGGRRICARLVHTASRSVLEI